MANSQLSDRLILVTGATGNQGGAVARELLKRGFRVRALTRNAHQPKAQALTQLGAEVVEGDLDNLTSIQSALTGVYGVFSVQNFWETGAEREIQQGIALADVAKAATVQHFVYSSVDSANQHTGVPHFDTKGQIESHIQQIGIPFTILRPAAFNYSWSDSNVRNSALKGMFSMPLNPATKLKIISEEDYAAMVAIAFENPDRWIGRSLDVASEELTMQQMAETFGRVIHRPVQYVQMSWEQSRQTVGEEYTHMFEFFENVGYAADLNVMRQEYSVLTPLEQYLNQHGWDNIAATV